MDHSHIVELTAALKEHDYARAAEALRLHTSFGKQLASDVIERHGGEVYSRATATAGPHPGIPIPAGAAPPSFAPFPTR